MLADPFFICPQSGDETYKCSNKWLNSNVKKRRGRIDHFDVVVENYARQ